MMSWGQEYQSGSSGFFSFLSIGVEKFGENSHATSTW